VRALDALLDYQDYPVAAGQNGAMWRRPLGIGVINYAYYLAKHGVRYSDGSALGLTHRTFEAIQYYLLKASVALAKELGPARALPIPPMPPVSCLSTATSGSWTKSAPSRCSWIGSNSEARSAHMACVTAP